MARDHHQEAICLWLLSTGGEEFNSVDLDQSVYWRAGQRHIYFPNVCITSSVLPGCKEVGQVT